MAYWPFPQGMNGIAPDYFPKVNTFLYEVYVESSVLTGLMSPGDSNAISVKGIEDSKGGAAIFGRLQARDYKHPILNNDQVRGVNRYQKTDTILVDADKITFKLDRDNVSVEQYAAMIHLTEYQARSLALDHRQYRDYKVFKSAMTNLYNCAVNGSMPQVSRAVAGVLDPANAADGVYAYNDGAALAAQLIAAMPDARAANHHAGVDHIMRCRTLAINKFLADPLEPMTVGALFGYDEPRFIYLCPPAVANNIRNDPKFIAFNYTRGINLPFQGSPVSGGFFVGRVEDVDIVEVPMLGDPDFRVTNANGTPTEFEWSLFLGRGAFGMFQKQGLMYLEEPDKIEDVQLQIARQHMGVKPLLFPNAAGAMIEQGIIHSFTRS